MKRDDESVFANLQAVTGATYDNANYNKDLLDVYLLQKARQKGVRLPTGDAPEEYKFMGAFVETTTAGINENVVYCDLASLYPSIIQSLNASPETLVGSRKELEESQYTEDDCVWGLYDPRPVKHLENGEDWKQYTDGTYKQVYDPHNNSVKWTCDEADGPQYEKLYFLDHDVERGFLAETVDDIVQLKEQYRGTSLYGSTKMVVNSIYGIVGFATENSSFRLFDWRLAEAVTLTGRKIIKGSRDRILDYLADEGYDDAYPCSGDTDATAVSLPSVATKDEALRVVGDAVDWLNSDGYDALMAEEFGVSPENHHTEIEIESFAPRLFIPSEDPPHSDVGVKKRYIQWETWNDDDGECDSISITGLEAERSDVAPVTRHAQEVFAETLRMDDGQARGKVFPELRELAQSIQNGTIDLDRVCKRGGLGQDLSEYGTQTRRPAPLYRGSKYANDNIEGVTIQRGDKVRVVYVQSTPDDYPSTYSSVTAEDGDVVDAVSLLNTDRMPDSFEVDWDRHWVKSLKEPMEPLLRTRGWSWSEILNQHEQTGLSSF